MYVPIDYPTKKAFLASVKAGIENPVYIPNGIFEAPKNGSGVVEGPHYPKPHKWYASVKIKNGIVVEAK